jgi:WD40 repeat protein
VSGSPDGTLKLWNLSTSECVRTLHTGFAAYVWSIDVSGDYVICGCDENIKVWNLGKGDSANTLMGHQDHVWGVQVLDECMISCSEDCTVRIWVQNENYNSNPKRLKKGKHKKRRALAIDDPSQDGVDPFGITLSGNSGHYPTFIEAHDSNMDANPVIPFEGA